MATSHGPDLSQARKAVERLMDDRCQIYRYPATADQDTMDPATGVLTTTARTMIYPTQAMIDDPDDDAVTDGPCQFRNVGEGFTTTQTKLQGGDPQTYRMYNMRAPINKCPPLREGDEVVCISSRRDPDLPDVVFTIRESMKSSFAISRKILVEEQPARRLVGQ